MDCLFCGHGDDDHTRQYRAKVPGHCEQPVCACVMFASTETQARYCLLPTYERWIGVVREARALGLDLAPLRPAR